MKNPWIIVSISALAGLSIIIPTPASSQKLIAYYPFNGNARDESGNNHHGTVSAATLTRDRFGNADRAYAFDEARQSFISVPHDSRLSFAKHPFTIAVWVKFCVSDMTTYAGIVVKGPKSDAYPGYQLVISDKDRMATQIGDDISTGMEGRGVTPLGDNIWHFLVLEVTPTTNTVLMWVDGIRELYKLQAAASAQLNASRDCTEPLYIGKERRSLIYFTGYIDDVRIYDSTLSQRAIDSLYHEKGWNGGSREPGSTNTVVTSCRGKNVLLTPDGAESFAWSTGATTPTLSVDKSGIYWVQRVSPAGCRFLDSFTVTIYPSPVIADEELQICEGSSITIGRQPVSGTPPFRYQWSLDSTLSSMTSATAVATPRATTRYSVTVTDSNGCSCNASVTVAVMPGPKALQVISPTHDGTVVLDSTEIGAERWDSIRVLNTGHDTLVVDRLSMARNVEFSVPPAQRLLRVPPGEERWIQLSYRPSNVRNDQDTLRFQADCTYRFVLESHGIEPLIQGRDVCGTTLQASLVDGKGHYLRLGVPYPNPASTEVSIPIEQTVGEDESPATCTLYNMKGMMIAEGGYLHSTLGRSVVPHVESGYFLFRVESIPAGFYIATVQAPRGVLHVPIIIHR